MIRLKKPLQVTSEDKVTHFHTIPTSSLNYYMGYEIMVDGEWVPVDKKLSHSLSSTFETVRRTIDKD